MLSDNGKILIYASSGALQNERLKIIELAAQRVSTNLRLGMEVNCRKEIISISVYYRAIHGEEIPLYCDCGKNCSEQEVYKAIRNMMFVLSFHPRFSILKDVRKEVRMGLS